jgi:hypothetical protein
MDVWEIGGGCIVLVGAKADSALTCLLTRVHYRLQVANYFTPKDMLQEGRKKSV